MRKFLVLSFLVASLALPAVAQPRVRTQQILSKVYTIDRIYRSMEGPGSIQRIYIGNPDRPELLWIVGVRTEMVGEDGKTPQLPEFMCHVNVDLDTKRHSTLFNLNRLTAPRLVTLSQGMLVARVPDGFGFPIASNEPLSLFTQVLNHNIERPNNLKVRHRVTFEYVRQSDLTTPMKPLFNIGASGMVLLDDNPLALASMPTAASMPGVDLNASHSTDSSSSSSMGDMAEHGHGTSCLVASRAPNAAGSASDYIDPKGRHMTGHWVVPPGKQTNSSDITWFMALPFDATLHYAAVHLHPYAKSLSIRDVTTGETVFESKAQNPPKGVGLAHVDTFSSEKGVRMYKDHEYELISVYDNTTKDNHDSMASAFLGLEDPEFVVPDPATLLARSTDLLDKGDIHSAILRTSIGDVGLILLRDQAPATVKQFLRLARLGVYDHAHVAQIQATTVSIQTRALSDVQRANVNPIVSETAAKHEPGALSMCPGDAAFTIILGNATDRDGRCTVFAKVGPGSQVVREMSAAPRNFDGSPQIEIEIKRIDIPVDAAAEAGMELAPMKPIAALR
ncbi:MAG: peptidylprolyl isomerase [Thermoanaerobaculia bacterium]